jgi:hypothetical protein
MKNTTTALLLCALLLQPLLTAAQQTSAQTENKKPETTSAQARAETEVKTIPAEELLPSSAMFFAVTTNLAGLLEGFRRLEAYKLLDTRLPKSERESEDNPLDLAARFVGMGIKEPEILSDTRIGLALLKPEFAAQTEPKTTEVKKTEAQNNVPSPHLIIFVEAANIEQAKKAREQFIAYYSDTFTDLGKPAVLKTGNDSIFKGAEIERFKNGYLGTMIGTTFLLGEAPAIQSVIRIQNSTDVERLSDDLEFIQSRGRLLAPTGLFAWVNGRALDSYLGLITQGVPFFLGTMSASLLPPGAIKSLALSSTFERDGVLDRLVVSLDPTKKNFFSTFFSGPSLEFRATRLIPEGTQIVISHSLDFARLYDDLIVPVVFGTMTETEAYKIAQKGVATRQPQKGETKKRGEEGWDEVDEFARSLEQARRKTQTPEFINSLISRTEKEVGLKFREEITKCLGNEIAIAYQIPKDPAVPDDKQTHFASLIGLRDRDAARVSINKLIAYAFGALGSGMTAGAKAADAENSSDDVVTDVSIPGLAGGARKEKSDEQLKKEQEQRLALLQMLPRENYKKAEIMSLMVFALAYVDDYLVIADSAETIKRMIDNAENGAGIERDPNYSRAMASAPASSGARVFVGPEYFDEMIGGFVKAWVVKPSDKNESAALNLPATIAGFVEAGAHSIRIEAFSPIGVPAMFLFDSLSDQVRSAASGNEFEAQSLLRTVAAAQKRYAAAHQERYGTLDELIKFQKENPKPEVHNTKMAPEERLDVAYRRDLSALRGEKNNYRFELKLKPESKGFEATATPAPYGRAARHSFFIDESGKLRRASRNGEPATARDELVTEEMNRDK